MLPTTITITTTGLLAIALMLLGVGQSAQAWWLFGQQAAPSAAADNIKAIAQIDMDGVKGAFKFTQLAGPNATSSGPTRVEYELTGLKGHNKLYHVHVRPVAQFEPEQVRNNATAIAELCSDPATGGHLNPHHITAKLPPKSAPLDKYEVGDLSGKHGPLEQAKEGAQTDHYAGSYIDDKLPMSGDNTIIGRSIVIHKNDGKRWVCATIVQTA